MSISLITGHLGVDHVTPLRDACVHRAQSGSESGIFEWGEKFTPSAVDNSTVTIASGVGMIQGRFFLIEPNTYETVTIASGASGYKRIDLICAHYHKDVSGGDVESVELSVIQGTAVTTSPEAPTVTVGDIDGGDVDAYMPLVSVTLNGTSISAVTIVADKIGAESKETLLWANPSSSSAISSLVIEAGSSGTTSEFAHISSYPWIKIVSKDDTSSYLMREHVVRNNANAVGLPKFWSDPTNTSGNIIGFGRRQVSVNASANRIYFGDYKTTRIKANGNITNNTQNNSELIPYRIYGLTGI